MQDQNNLIYYQLNYYNSLKMHLNNHYINLISNLIFSTFITYSISFPLYSKIIFDMNNFY